NPHWIPELRPFTGQDPDVRDYVLGQVGAKEFLDRYHELLRLVGAGYLREGKRYLTLAVGCTGGKHRSVTMAEDLARRLADDGVQPRGVHRALGREGSCRAASAHIGGPAGTGGRAAGEPAPGGVPRRRARAGGVAGRDAPAHAVPHRGGHGGRRRRLVGPDPARAVRGAARRPADGAGRAGGRGRPEPAVGGRAAAPGRGPPRAGRAPDP